MHSVTSVFSVVNKFCRSATKRSPLWGDLLQTVYAVPISIGDKDLFLVVLLLELLHTTGSVEEHLLARVERM